MPRASSEATERASTAVLCEIMTGIDVEVGIARLGGHMSDSSEAWLLTLKRLRREQNTAEAAVARKIQEHQATAAAWADPRSRPWRSTSTRAVTRAHSWCAPISPRGGRHVSRRKGSGWLVGVPRDASP